MTGVFIWFTRVPALVSLALIWFISYEFLFEFLPDQFGNQMSKFIPLLAIFAYATLQSQLFLVRTLMSDPGWLPDSLKRKRGGENNPEKELRLFRMRHY